MFWTSCDLIFFSASSSRDIFVLNDPTRGLTLSLSPLPVQAALKKYQLEHKSKGESLEKCQGELKKLRRKSQGSKNPSKYGEKEMQVSPLLLFDSEYSD